MELRTHLDSLPRGGISELAGRIGISTVYLQQLASKRDGRKPSPELSLLIERATGGAVTRSDLRPDDCHLIWPDLVKRKGAPAKAEA